MNRSKALFGTALLAAVLAVALLAGGVAAAAAPAGSAPTAAQLNATDNTTTDGIATNATAPGAQLAGVIGVQQTEVAGEVDNRSFGLRVANAASDDDRAAIIAARQAETRQRVATQAQQLADLRAAREAGNLTDSEYRARVAIVAAQAATTERTVGQLNRTARDLPESVRERNGINVTAIDRLRTEARTLGGPETAAIARGISGTTARNPLGDSPRGPPAATPGAGRAGQQRGGQAGPSGERGPRSGSEAGDMPEAPEAGATTAGAQPDRGTTQPDRPAAGNDAAGNTGSDTSGPNGQNAASNDRGGSNGGPSRAGGGSDNAGGSNRP